MLSSTVFPSIPTVYSITPINIHGRVKPGVCSMPTGNPFFCDDVFCTMFVLRLVSK